MRSYLEACTVPTVHIGKAELPRLIMGIHPYDGCSYVDRARDADNLRAFGRVGPVADVLRYAVEEVGVTVAQVDHMFPVLNRLHLQAIWETERVTSTQIGLVAYLLIPITLDGKEVTYSDRAHSTLYAHDERVGGQAFREHMAGDEIMCYLLDGESGGLVTPETVPPFTPEEAARLEIDYAALERHLGFYAGCEILVADPGAEIQYPVFRVWPEYVRHNLCGLILDLKHPFLKGQ